MNEKTVSVLFMDDEPASEIVGIAVDWMTDEGFEVDVVESMRDAVDAFYEKFYDVFVLDIDMSLNPDGEEGDGVNVLKRFVALHNRTSVIMFSGAGTVPHWFAAANAHCYAYVHKNEKNSVPRLVEFIRKSKEDKKSPEKFVDKNCPSRVLVFDGDGKYRERIEKATTEALGNDWIVETTGSLSDAKRMVEQDDGFGIVLLFQDLFKLYAEEKGAIASILSRSPAPQVVVGCMGEDQYQPSILFIANNRPFRMIDTNVPAWPERLQEALKDAVVWYGQREIFQADPEAIKRMRVALPPEALEDWEYSSEDLDELCELLERQASEDEDENDDIDADDNAGEEDE